LICDAGGIVIASTDVTLALEGHRITAGVNANGAIDVNPSQVTPLANIHILGPGLITNGGANHFSTGVSLFNTNNSEVSGITVLDSGTGIFTTRSCNFLTITANTLGRNTVGISLSSSNSTISKNDVSGSIGVGIGILNFSPLSAGMVSHNIVNGNGRGVLIVGIVTVQNNVVNGNGLDGIHVEFIPDNFTGAEVLNNTSLANAGSDLFDEGRVAREPCGAATSSSRLTKVAFIEEAG
jgi:parallel beta-helix repeat protein